MVTAREIFNNIEKSRNDIIIIFTYDRIKDKKTKDAVVRFL